MQLIFKIRLLISVASLIVHADSIAQVPVFEEPHHQVALLNSCLRLIDVHIRPGDTTLYHRHFNPSIVVFITANRTGSQPKGGSPSSGTAVPGKTFFAPYDQKPIAHRVWNEDTSVYHVMDIEMLNKPGTNAPPLLKGDGIEIAQDEPMVRVYHFQIQPGHEVTVPSDGFAKLLIGISSSQSEIDMKSSATSPVRLNPGQFKWIEGSEGLQIKNKGNSGAEFVLLVCK
jgi:hypothetical protein